MGRRVSIPALVVVVGLSGASTLSAQALMGAIEGTVKDESGALLPGVTVEVSSPAMIEGTRTTLTGNDGSYRILRLPVGDYKVKFSLDGFSGVERDRVVLNSGFTATISATLTVGSVAETLTVVGQSPVIDVRTTTSQTVLTDDIVNTLPSARTVFDMTKFLIGASTGRPDVGGTSTILYTPIQIHGSLANDRSYLPRWSAGRRVLWWRRRAENLRRDGRPVGGELPDQRAARVGGQRRRRHQHGVQRRGEPLQRKRFRLRQQRGPAVCQSDRRAQDPGCARHGRDQEGLRHGRHLRWTGEAGQRSGSSGRDASGR